MRDVYYDIQDVLSWVSDYGERNRNIGKYLEKNHGRVRDEESEILFHKIESGIYTIVRNFIDHKYD